MGCWSGSWGEKETGEYGQGVLNDPLLPLLARQRHLALDLARDAHGR